MVLNLSQQTDSSDLLGGFRPVEARAALAPLLARFQELVADTWTRGRNAEFLARVARVAERRKWPQLLAAFRSALRKVRSLVGRIECMRHATLSVPASSIRACHQTPHAALVCVHKHIAEASCRSRLWTAMAATRT